MAQSDKYHYVTRIVAEATWAMDEDAETEDIDGQDGWVFSRSLPLPKNLKDCVQSVETHGIKVKHQVKFVVALLNPDGHKSEVSFSLHNSAGPFYTNSSIVPAQSRPPHPNLHLPQPASKR